MCYFDTIWIISTAFLVINIAIYDRFGRLIQGSEILAKDVLEYVVFEKHVSNEYGVWRIHGKIIPDWLPSRESPSKTFKKLPDIESSDVLETQEKNVQQQTTETQPAAA